MATTSKVSVPKSVGDEIIISYGGDDPITYRVTDGHVTVHNNHLETFLANVEGSKVISDSADTGKKDN